MKTKISALILVLALVMSFALVACQPEAPAPVEDQQNVDANADDTQAPVEDNKEAVEGDQTPVEDEQAPADTAEDDNVIIMATNAYFKPYEFYEGEKIVGIDAEIAEAIAAKLGKTLQIADMQFDTILTAVLEGSVDFGMAGMTVTEERLESVNFTSSYASGVQSIIVKEGSPIASVDDLYAEGAAYKVGVQLGTTGDIYSTDDFGAENVVQYSNGNEAVLALAGGSVDCVIIDNEPAKALVAANEGLVILETAYAEEDYAICVAKENTELLNALNTAIDELIADGTIDTIVAKYIK
ncbi:MAG: amino acid ABC transporter substrate-binding protein [Ruminococcaceae bacterium]|nr:amino acid ABC transporter substrate-binding protein [Oscillospiraceae bacterium]